MPLVMTKTSSLKRAPTPHCLLEQQIEEDDFEPQVSSAVSTHVVQPQQPQYNEFPIISSTTPFFQPEETKTSTRSNT